MACVCELCGDNASCVPAVAYGFLPGFFGWTDRSPIRWTLQAGKALLHHRCADPRVRTSIDPDRNWFACENPQREIDLDAVFDPYCSSCEARWELAGSEIWNVEPGDPD